MDDPVAEIIHSTASYPKIVRLMDVGMLPHGTKLYAMTSGAAIRIADLEAEIERLRAMLKRCKQYTKTQDYDGVPICNCCYDYPCKPGCELARMVG